MNYKGGGVVECKIGGKSKYLEFVAAGACAFATAGGVRMGALVQCEVVEQRGSLRAVGLRACEDSRIRQDVVQHKLKNQGQSSSVSIEPVQPSEPQPGSQVEGYRSDVPSTGSFPTHEEHWRKKRKRKRRPPASPTEDLEPSSALVEACKVDDVAVVESNTRVEPGFDCEFVAQAPEPAGSTIVATEPVRQDTYDRNIVEDMPPVPADVDSADVEMVLTHCRSAVEDVGPPCADIVATNDADREIQASNAAYSLAALLDDGQVDGRTLVDHVNKIVPALTGPRGAVIGRTTGVSTVRMDAAAIRRIRSGQQHHLRKLVIKALEHVDLESDRLLHRKLRPARRKFKELKTIFEAVHGPLASAGAKKDWMQLCSLLLGDEEQPPPVPPIHGDLPESDSVDRAQLEVGGSPPEITVEPETISGYVARYAGEPSADVAANVCTSPDLALAPSSIDQRAETARGKSLECIPPLPGPPSPATAASPSSGRAGPPASSQLDAKSAWESLRFGGLPVESMRLAKVPLAMRTVDHSVRVERASRGAGEHSDRVCIDLCESPRPVDGLAPRGDDGPLDPLGGDVPLGDGCALYDVDAWMSDGDAECTADSSQQHFEQVVEVELEQERKKPPWKVEDQEILLKATQGIQCKQQLREIYARVGEELGKSVGSVRIQHLILTDERYMQTRVGKGRHKKGVLRNLAVDAMILLGGKATAHELIRCCRQDAHLQQRYAQDLCWDMVRRPGSQTLMPLWERGIFSGMAIVFTASGEVRDGLKVYRFRTSSENIGRRESRARRRGVVQQGADQEPEGTDPESPPEA